MKCFLLNPEKKIGANPSFVVFEKNALLNPKDDVIVLKAKRLGYSNYQLKSC